MTDPADEPSPRLDSPIDGALRLEGLDDGVEHLFATRPTTTGGTASPFGDAREATRRLWSGDTGPLIATGHQATFRHPGILAKDLVANGLANALGGRTLRLLVDQDVHPIGPLQIPLRASSGELRAVGVACREPHLDAPTGRRPPMELDPEGPPAGLSREIAAGVDAIGEALRRESEAPSAALQVAAAMDALVEGVAPLPPSQPATELLSTPIGLATLAAIAEAPRACAATFNEALALDPRAARPLRIEPERVEVPLWWIGSNRPRERVHLDPREPAAQRLDRLRDAAVALPSGLAPRGLLMTGLVRLVARRRPGPDGHGLGGSSAAARRHRSDPRGDPATLARSGERRRSRRDRGRRGWRIRKHQRLEPLQRPESPEGPRPAGDRRGTARVRSAA